MSKVNTAFFLLFLGAPSRDPPFSTQNYVSLDSLHLFTVRWAPGAPVGCVHGPCVPCDLSSAFQHPVTQPYVPNMFCSLCPSAPAFCILQAE